MGRNLKYSDILLSQVKKDVIENIFTMKEISIKFNIPIKTIDNHFGGLRIGLGRCKNIKINNLSNWNKKPVKEKELKIKIDKKGFRKVFKSSYWVDLQKIGNGREYCFIY